MANLRARVLPLTLVTSLVAIAPVFAAGSELPTFTVGQNPFGNSQSGTIRSASSQYLVLDSSEISDGRVWDIQNKQFLDLTAGNDSHGAASYASAAFVSGNVVVGIRDNDVYQWTLNGSSVTGRVLGPNADTGVYGVTGSSVAGYTTYSYMKAGLPFELSAPNATYWDSNGAHVLPTGSDRESFSQANAVAGNKVVGWTQYSGTNQATLWTVNTSDYTSTQHILSTAAKSEAIAISGNGKLVGGFVAYQHDEGKRNHATVWQLPESSDGNITQIDLHPEDNDTTKYYKSDVTAVESDVKIGDIIYDIVVGSVNINDVTTAALWLLGDGIGSAEHPYEMITLSNAFPDTFFATYATSIVVEDGKLAAIYGFGERADGDGYIPLVWSASGVGAEVPEPMAAAILLVGACGMMLRRPHRA